MLYIVTELPTTNTQRDYQFEFTRMPIETIPRSNIKIITTHTPSAKVVSNVLGVNFSDTAGDTIHRVTRGMMLRHAYVFIYAKFNIAPNTKNVKTIGADDVEFYRVTYNHITPTTIWTIRSIDGTVDEKIRRYFDENRHFTIKISNDLCNMKVFDIWNSRSPYNIECQTIEFGCSGTTLKVRTYTDVVFMFEVDFLVH